MVYQVVKVMSRRAREVTALGDGGVHKAFFKDEAMGLTAEGMASGLAKAVKGQAMACLA